MRGEGSGTAKSMNAEKMFEHLKSQGLVAKERHFRQKRRHRDDINARARSFPRRRITFYGDDTRMSDRAVAFVILHEEGHLSQKMNSLFMRAYIVMLLALPMGLVSWKLLTGEESQAEDCFFMAMIIIFALSTPRIFREPLMEDEILADTHAGKSMVAFDPDLSRQQVKTIFEEVLGPLKGSGLFKRFALFLGWDIHPPLAERIEIVFNAMTRGHGD